MGNKVKKLLPKAYAELDDPVHDHDDKIVGAFSRYLDEISKLLHDLSTTVELAEKAGKNVCFDQSGPSQVPK